MATTGYGQTSKNPARLDVKGRADYWGDRWETEGKQLKLLQKRMATLEKQIAKQQQVYNWAMGKMDAANEAFMEAQMDQESPYFDENAEY